MSIDYIFFFKEMAAKEKEEKENFQTELPG